MYLSLQITFEAAKRATDELSERSGLPAVLIMDQDNCQWIIAASMAAVVQHPHVDNAPVVEHDPPVTSLEQPIHLDFPSTTKGQKQQEHIPRPPNSWILYRQAHSRRIHEESPGMSAGEISKEIAAMWRNESTDVKDHYKTLAAAEAQKHKERYPDYKFRATKRGGKGPAKRELLSFIASASPDAILASM
ncbi:hypothetical protein BN1708_008291 [Verticillium longisporum]|uniref:Mating type protein 1-2-1 n=1 Tax=Verticillium longisporum TaxID=100787 RepID=A0A0G4N2U5_VERLO|nr:mating type protein 1-2-1 [Verticillium longisporum]CRK40699.1 hypothetical protein BN1708_008291 [Verticillium longisporum]